VTITDRDRTTDRERLEKELTLARELALAIGSAETVDRAMETTLSKICEATGWELGEAWVRRGDKLELGGTWYSSRALEPLSEGMPYFKAAEGVGLPGHAWSTGRPIWMRDVSSDPRFLRAELARNLGLAAGMAVPVLSGDGVEAVLLFFVSEAREEDEHLINLVSAVSAQLGSLVRRKQAEDARGQSEEHLRAIADTALDAIVSSDSGGRILYVNGAAEKIFGYEKGEMIGLPLSALMPKRFRLAHQGGFQRYLETGEAHIIGRRIELAGRRKDGKEFPLEVALASWSAGDERYFTGMLRDISERRRAEESLRQSDELKTALLRSVSHDLRSPLTAIVAAGESSASPVLDDESRNELASVIVGEASRLSRLVDKLLDLSRLQGGAAAPRRVQCSVEELVYAAIEQLHLPDERFEVDIPHDLPSVLTDATQLERALVNLFENSSRFAGERPVRVAASASDGTLEVRISDNGPGVAEEDRERIFEPFYRAPQAQMDHPGSGLGLAIVKGFVEANGGTVRVEPAEGQGTTFVITMPASPGASVAGAG
jgi:PAS domain S-box-containing protein